MAKRYAAQALAEWWEKRKELYADSTDKLISPTILLNGDSLTLAPIKMLDELLREHNEMQARKKESLKKLH